MIETSRSSNKSTYINYVRRAYAEMGDFRHLDVPKAVVSVVGKAVVSADHGNLFGERMRPIPMKMWGHPPKLEHPLLTDVPWLQMPHETRRKTKADPPLERTTEMDESDVEKRLRALGYTQ